MAQKSIPSSFFQSITSAHCLFVNSHMPFSSSMSPAVPHCHFSTTDTIQGLRANNLSETDELIQTFERGAVACSDIVKICQALTINCNADQGMDSALQTCGVQLKTQIIEQVLSQVQIPGEACLQILHIDWPS